MYSEFFWPVFSRIQAEYGEIAEIRNIYPYLNQMQKNTEQENSEYGHFSRSAEKSSNPVGLSK